MNFGKDTDMRVMIINAMKSVMKRHQNISGRRGIDNTIAVQLIKLVRQQPPVVGTEVITCAG